MVSITRFYQLAAKQGKASELESALRVLFESVVRIDGSQGAEILRDCRDKHRFVVMERWACEQAYQVGAIAFRKLDLAPVLAAADGPIRSDQCESAACFRSG